MKYVFLVDLSRVIVFPKEKTYLSDLNPLYTKESRNKRFNFKKLFVFNDELLDYLDKLAESFELYLYTSGTMQNDHQIKAKISNMFTDIFSGSLMSLPKTDPNSYLEISEILNKSPEEIIFIDDNIENISAAKKAKIIAIHFRDNNSLFQQIERAIS